jgi:hypothetical protein
MLNNLDVLEVVLDLGKHILNHLPVEEDKIYPHHIHIDLHMQRTAPPVTSGLEDHFDCHI